jgi:hypothetical protein
MQLTPPTQRRRGPLRRLLDESGLEQPDAMEVAPDELVFFWSEPKVAVVVELDDSSDGEAAGAAAGPPPGQPRPG